MARIHRALLAGFIGLEMADLTVTLIGFHLGASEGNPLMFPLAHFWPVLALVKLVMVAVVSGIVLVFFHAGGRGRFIGTAIAGYGCLACAVVLAHNLAVLAR